MVSVSWLNRPRLVKRGSTTRGKKVDFHTHTKRSDMVVRGLVIRGLEGAGPPLRVDFASCGQGWLILIGAGVGGLWNKARRGNVSIT